MTLDELLRRQAGILHRRQALAAGVTRHALEHRPGDPSIKQEVGRKVEAG